MPMWKKLLYGFLAIIGLMIFAGNGAEAGDLVNEVIAGLKSAINGFSDFVGSLKF